MNHPDFMMPLVAIVVVFLMFLVLRELVCWYWKINQSVALLIEIRDSLKAMETSNWNRTDSALPPSTRP